MSEQVQQVSEKEQKAKPKQEAQRNFGCPCGKKYLSYPALFTHVKQKHDGSAPGQLIKPVNDKPRGRPKLQSSVQQFPKQISQKQSSSDNYDCSAELKRTLQERTLAYHADFPIKQGKNTCQHMATAFLSVCNLQSESKQILFCFLNYLRHWINLRFENQFWEREKPAQIIDVSNEIVHELENYKVEYPLERDLLIDLLFILFRWMYLNKWTEHKLLRRNVDEEKSDSK